MLEKTSEEFHIIIDFHGKKIRLFHHTIDHIKLSHPEISDPLTFVTEILKQPILITEDELPNTQIYHKRAKKPLMHVAYVEVEKALVKTAHISDRVKGGHIVWFAESKDLIL